MFWRVWAALVGWYWGLRKPRRLQQSRVRAMRARRLSAFRGSRVKVEQSRVEGAQGLASPQAQHPQPRNCSGSAAPVSPQRRAWHRRRALITTVPFQSFGARGRREPHDHCAFSIPLGPVTVSFQLVPRKAHLKHSVSMCSGRCGDPCARSPAQSPLKTSRNDVPKSVWNPLGPQGGPH